MRAIITILFIASLVPSTAMAKISCKFLNKVWSERYHREFKVAWKLGTFECPSDMARIAETTYYLHKIKFKVPEGQKTLNFYRYVVKDLVQLRFEKESSFNSNARASEINGRITLFKFFTEDKNTLRRIKSLVHEARHIRKDDPGHVKCKTGAHSGSRSCDNNFYEKPWKGSGYNYSFKYYWWFYHHSYNHKLDKKQAKLKMKYMILNRFNNVTNEQVRRYTK